MNIMADKVLKLCFFMKNNSPKNVKRYGWWWKWIESQKVHKKKKKIILRHKDLQSKWQTTLIFVNWIRTLSFASDRNPTQARSWELGRLRCEDGLGSGDAGMWGPPEPSLKQGRRVSVRTTGQEWGHRRTARRVAGVCGDEKHTGNWGIFPLSLPQVAFLGVAASPLWLLLSVMKLTLVLGSPGWGRPRALVTPPPVLFLKPVGASRVTSPTLFGFSALASLVLSVSCTKFLLT